MAIDSAYVETTGIRLLSGRMPRAGESDGAVVVDQAFARRFWPDGTAIGSKFSLGLEGSPGTTTREVMGIASSIGVRYAEAGDVFVAYEPLPTVGAPLSFIVRLALADALPDMTDIARCAAGSPRVRAMHMKDRYAEVYGDARIAAQMTRGIGFLAWLVIALGIYGLTTSLARGRTREISIRIAVGAPRRHVQGLILRSTLSAVGIGVVMGVAAAMLTARWWAVQLVGIVRPMRPATWQLC